MNSRIESIFLLVTKSNTGKKDRTNQLNMIIWITKKKSKIGLENINIFI